MQATKKNRQTVNMSGNCNFKTTDNEKDLSKQTGRPHDEKARCPERNKTRSTTCDICNRKFREPRFMEQHRRDKHSNKYYRAQSAENQTEASAPFRFCESCNKEFSSKEDYQRHMITDCHKMNFVGSIFFKEIKKGKEINIANLKRECSKVNNEIMQKIAEDDNKQFEAILNDYYEVLRLSRRKPIGPNENFICSKCGIIFMGLEIFEKHLKKHGRKGTLN
ncbi:zinc finger and BTB domain-containing protein 49-like [Uloborus diversus]|uniref:zinc finger and BTB domain-containing protein 49-like n=1 Tax=Uloborus diversus TaxID=327109 RepID=UPI00240A23B9|nr:zinc finger and BTB domain-containing protein 49-like [Uloborus diversus]